MACLYMPKKNSLVTTQKSNMMTRFICSLMGLSRRQKNNLQRGLRARTKGLAQYIKSQIGDFLLSMH